VEQNITELDDLDVDYELSFSKQIQVYTKNNEIVRTLRLQQLFNGRIDVLIGSCDYGDINGLEDRC